MQPVLSRSDFREGYLSLMNCDMQLFEVAESHLRSHEIDVDIYEHHLNSMLRLGARLRLSNHLNVNYVMNADSDEAASVLIEYANLMGLDASQSVIQNDGRSFIVIHFSLGI